MTGRWRLTVAGTLALAATLTSAGAGAQQVFRGGVDVVTVDVAVTKGDRPVTGLTAADFILKDNGVPQQITMASAESLSIDLTLVLDVSDSLAGPMLARLKTAIRDTAALLGPRDRMRLIALSNELHEVFGFQSGTAVPPLDTLSARGATSLHDGLMALMMQDHEMERRQLVLAYTDGGDTLSFFDARSAEQIARLADVVVDVAIGAAPPPRRIVGSRLPRALPPRPDAARLALDRLTAATGGVVTTFDLNDATAVGRTFGRLLADFRTGYVLRFSPAGVSRDGWHDLAVTVTRAGAYDVRARKGYSAGGSPAPPISVAR